MQHRGHSGSTALAKSSKSPEARAVTTPTEDLEKSRGRLSNPSQRRLCPSTADDLIAAYQAGATLNQLADHYGIHRTTVAAHVDRHGAPRHDDRTAWDEGALEEAAEMYAAGLSLVDVASRFGIDAQTVANRFRRAGRPIRPRRGWRLQP